MLDLFEKMIGGIEGKKEYKRAMKRVDAFPEDYRFVYRKIQHYMWNFASGSGMDILQIQYELIDLFETGVAEGKEVLEITGKDVAAFADGLLSQAKNYVEDRRAKLNREVMKKLGKEDGAQ